MMNLREAIFITTVILEFGKMFDKINS